MTTKHRHLVALAFAREANLLSANVDLDDDDVTQLRSLCMWLAHQGELAGFEILPNTQALDLAAFRARIAEQVGELLVEACTALRQPREVTPPSSLMLVWSFDHQIDGKPASTGRLFGLDLELIADPSPSDDEGASIPGLPGRWLIHARALCSADLARKVPATDR